MARLRYYTSGQLVISKRSTTVLNRSWFQLLVVTFVIVVPTQLLLLASIEAQEPQTGGSAVPRNAANARDSIQDAIQLLGDPDPAKRLAARNKIVKFAKLAIPELEKAARFETTLDHEIQSQALELVALLRKSQAKGLAAKFVDGTETLTGWPEFASVCGDSRQSRELYQDIYLKYESQIKRIISQPKNLTYPEISVLFKSRNREQTALGLFLYTYSARKTDGNFATKMQQQQLEGLVGSLLGNAAELFKPKKQHRLPMIQLVCSFFDSAPELLPARKLSILRTIEHPLVDAQLLKLTDRNFPPIVRAMAMASLSGQDAPAVVKQLEKYLDDETFVGEFLVDAGLPAASNAKDRSSGNRSTGNSDNEAELKKLVIAKVQIRDISLLASLRITKKKHTDFGFCDKAISNGQPRIDIKRAGFSDDASRRKAFKLWRETREIALPNSK